MGEYDIYTRLILIGIKYYVGLDLYCLLTRNVKDLEAELLSHRAALDKIQMEKISDQLDDEDITRVNKRLSSCLERTKVCTLFIVIL